MFLGVSEGKRKWRTVLCKVMVFKCAYLQGKSLRGYSKETRAKCSRHRSPLWFVVALLFCEIAWICPLDFIREKGANTNIVIDHVLSEKISVDQHNLTGDTNGILKCLF